MKYLKKFENKEESEEPKFKVGDYVVAKNLTYDYELKHYMEKTVTQIDKIKNTDRDSIRHKFRYYVEYYNPPIKFKSYFDTINSITDILYDYELRFATPEEIEKYKFQQTIDKYNL